MSYSDQLSDLDKRIDLLTKDIQHLSDHIKDVKEDIGDIKAKLKDNESAFGFVRFIVNHPMLVFWVFMMILYLIGKHLLNIDLPFIADK